MFAGKTVIVTGADRIPITGIALEIVRQGAKKLLLIGDEKEALEVLRQRIAEIGGQAFVYACDVTDLSAVVMLAEETKSRFGCFDYLISDVEGGRLDILPAATKIKMHAEGSYVVTWVEKRENKGLVNRRAPHRLDYCI